MSNLNINAQSIDSEGLDAETLDLGTSDIEVICGSVGEGGDGISNITYERSTVDGGDNTMTITLSSGEQTVVKIKNGSKGAKGDKGDTGATGATGAQGPQGEQGIQGVQGEKGEKGDKGDAPVKGVDYFDGLNGANGTDGVGISDISVDESSESGGNNVVHISLTNGESAEFNVKNGVDGQGGGSSDTPQFMQRFIVGYSVTKSQPDDWETNYTDYFEKSGEEETFTFVSVSGESAPTWAAATYYKKNESMPDLIRIRSYEGYNFPLKEYKKVLLYIDSPASTDRTSSININRGDSSLISQIRAITQTTTPRISVLEITKMNNYLVAEVKVSYGTTASINVKITNYNTFGEILIGKYSGSALALNTAFTLYALW